MTLALYLLGINAFTYFLYWWDKRAARRGDLRVPEATLLIAGFAGGTVAAVLAQQIVRHKNRKTSFQMAFWAVTLIQLYLLIAQPGPVARLLARFG